MSKYDLLRKECFDAAFGKPQPVLSAQTLAERNARIAVASSQPSSIRTSHSDPTNVLIRASGDDQANTGRKRGMVLPFQPLSITFEDIHYSVDMPQVRNTGQVNRVCKKSYCTLPENGVFNFIIKIKIERFLGESENCHLSDY